MSSRALTRWLLIACVAATAAAPSTALAQDPGSGQYTESAPNFQPAEPEPEPAPAPTPTPAPAPAPAPTSAPPVATPSAEPTATTAAETLPVTGADPRLGLAGAMLLMLGLALRRSARLS